MTTKLNNLWDKVSINKIELLNYILRNYVFFYWNEFVHVKFLGNTSKNTSKKLQESNNLVEAQVRPF